MCKIDMKKKPVTVAIIANGAAYLLGVYTESLTQLGGSVPLVICYLAAAVIAYYYLDKKVASG